MTESTWYLVVIGYLPFDFTVPTSKQQAQAQTFESDDNKLCLTYRWMGVGLVMIATAAAVLCKSKCWK